MKPIDYYFQDMIAGAQEQAFRRARCRAASKGHPPRRRWVWRTQTATSLEVLANTKSEARAVFKKRYNLTRLPSFVVVCEVTG